MWSSAQLGFLLVAMVFGVAHAELGKCLIVFDFDGVIKIRDSSLEGRSYAEETMAVMQEVKNAGLDVGLATASCEIDFIKQYLNEQIDPEIFTPEFLESDAAQYCEKSKGIETAKIVEHYDADPICTILFDDSIGNHDDLLKEAGTTFKHLDKNVGITMEAYKDAVNGLQANPPCYC